MFVFHDFTRKVKISPVDVYVDNFIFRLHYRLTFWFLVACSVLVSSRQFINTHINCLVNGVPVHVVNTFCFFSSTFTVSKYYEKSSNHTGHPGIGHHSENDAIVRHAYYQWVPFVLFLQAVMFVLPHKIWKSYENKRLEKIVEFVKTSKLVADTPTSIKGQKIDSPDSIDCHVEWLRSTYMSEMRFRVNRDWARWLVFCEVLNALNLIFQFWLTDLFLQGMFMELGWDWWHGEESSLDRVFPKVTKCTFYKYGHAGSMQHHDVLCVMALNIINEKIYCCMWFWFVFLIIMDLVGLAWRLLTVYLHRNRLFNKWVWGEISPGPAIPHKDLTMITKHLTFSDWLFLYYLGKNIDSNVFRKMVSQLANELDTQTQIGQNGNRLLLNQSETYLRPVS